MIPPDHQICMKKDEFSLSKFLHDTEISISLGDVRLSLEQFKSAVRAEQG